MKTVKSFFKAVVQVLATGIKFLLIMFLFLTPVLFLVITGCPFKPLVAFFAVAGLICSVSAASSLASSKTSRSGSRRTSVSGSRSAVSYDEDAFWADQAQAQQQDAMRIQQQMHDDAVQMHRQAQDDAMRMHQQALDDAMRMHQQAQDDAWQMQQSFDFFPPMGF